MPIFTLTQIDWNKNAVVNYICLTLGSPLIDKKIAFIWRKEYINYEEPQPKIWAKNHVSFLSYFCLVFYHSHKRSDWQICSFFLIQIFLVLKIMFLIIPINSVLNFRMKCPLGVFVYKHFYASKNFSKEEIPANFQERNNEACIWMWIYGYSI